MIDTETLPAPTAPAEHHADFLELQAFKSTDRRASIYEYIRDLNLGNAPETLADDEVVDPALEDADSSEALAEEAFRELDDRLKACGKDSEQYPFQLSADSVTLRASADQSVYSFLALLSWYGHQAGPAGSDAEKLFEEVCAHAAANYLGAPNALVKRFVFGFPRRVAPAGFKAAVDKLCQELEEGQGHHTGRPKLPHEKDAKLDIVAWRDFGDRRAGKLINFGQCATGANWTDKVTELPPTVDWCTTWMAERPGVWPLRSFFVPHRIDHTNWFDTCVKGGILFDRCRIASLTKDLDANLSANLATWSSHVLATNVRGA